MESWVTAYATAGGKKLSAALSSNWPDVCYMGFANSLFHSSALRWPPP
jgi:hypothetical protein